MNKASGSHGIPTEQLQILKDDAVKVLHSISQQVWPQEVATARQKANFHSSLRERQCQRMSKLPQNCIHLTQ